MKKVTDQFQGSYIKQINNQIQTHALYGIRDDYFQIEKAKDELSKEGADKFRIVKGKHGFVAICFRLPTIK
jgi:hypothetical protein